MASGARRFTCLKCLPSTTEFVFDTCFPLGHLEFWYTLGLLTDSIKCGLNKSLRSPYPYCWVYLSSESCFLICVPKPILKYIY